MVADDAPAGASLTRPMRSSAVARRAPTPRHGTHSKERAERREDVATTGNPRHWPPAVPRRLQMNAPNVWGLLQTAALSEEIAAAAKLAKGRASLEFQAEVERVGGVFASISRSLTPCRFSAKCAHVRIASPLRARSSCASRVDSGKTGVHASCATSASSRSCARHNEPGGPFQHGRLL